MPECRKLPGSLGAVVTAEVCEAAAVTLRSSGNADGASVIHEAVAELVALLGRNNLPQGLLYLRRFLDVVRQPDQVAEADAVRVGYDSRLPVHISENEVRTFAPDAGKSEKLLHVVRDDVMVLLVQNLHAGADVSGLGVSETAGTNDRLDILRRGRGKCGHIREFPEQILHHDINPGIGALCGKAHADEKLPGVPVIQGAPGVRIFLFQPSDDGKSQFFFLLKIIHCFFYSIVIYPVVILAWPCLRADPDRDNILWMQTGRRLGPACAQIVTEIVFRECGLAEVSALPVRRI